MRHSRRLSFGSLGVVALALGVILSGCGTSTTRAQQGTETPQPTAAATSTPIPTATPSSATLSETAGCPLNGAASPSQYIAAGALNVSPPYRTQDFPSALMPDNVPNAPYQIAAGAVNAYAPNPPVNPHLSPGYFVQICNETGAPHTLTTISVTIASFKARSGPVADWNICDNGLYDAATHHTTGGCGGGFEALMLTATLPNNSAGASAPVTGLTWPATIGPNESIALAIGVDGLNSQGLYALSFGISVDGAAPTTVTPSDGSFLIAPSASVWTGAACQTPAMQAQIPPASQVTYYVCPPAA